MRPSMEVIGLHSRQGMHTRVPRRPRQRTLIPHYTAITRDWTIALPIAIRSPDIRLSPKPAYRRSRT